MLPPDKINPGTDPLFEHGGLRLPEPRPGVTLAFRARSGCYLSMFCFMVLLLVGLCSAMVWGGWMLAEIAASGLVPLVQIDAIYIVSALFCGLLLFLAFVVGFILPPWRKTR